MTDEEICELISFLQLGLKDGEQLDDDLLEALADVADDPSDNSDD